MSRSRSTIVDDARGTDPTYEFQVVHAGLPDLSDAQLLASSGVIPGADLRVGRRVVVPLPAGQTLRYIGVRYVPTGEAPTLLVHAHLQPAKLLERLQTYAGGPAIV